MSKENITTLSEQALPEGQYWIYTTIGSALPSKQFPLVQSYVDIFLHGCLELEEKYQLQNFATDCIKTTKYWSGEWVNDRNQPRTAEDNIPYAYDVDQLIAKNLPEYYNKIRLD